MDSEHERDDELLDQELDRDEETVYNVPQLSPDLPDQESAESAEQSVREIIKEAKKKKKVEAFVCLERQSYALPYQ